MIVKTVTRMVQFHVTGSTNWRINVALSTSFLYTASMNMQSVHHSLSHTLWDGDATAELHMNLASWHCRYNTHNIHYSFSLRFNGHFPGEPGLASVCWSKGWWRWWWQLDYWSYKSCKAPVTSSPPTNQHPVFYRPDALPVAQPTVSKHSHSMDLLTPSSPGVFQLCLWPLTAPGYPWLPCLSSALWCQYPVEVLC